MATVTVENYIKQIYLERLKIKGDVVSMGSIATALEVAPGTATTMVKSLADSELVEYEPRVGVRLKDNGEKMALGLLRRHRLIELFLVKILGLDWSEIHDEAEMLEHVLSDKVMEKIDVLLGRPKIDPHGDPIPSATGMLDERNLVPLNQCEIDLKIKISRITDQQADFLKFLEKNGLMPGVTITIIERNQFADSIMIKIDEGESISLGSAAAKKILVELIS